MAIEYHPPTQLELVEYIDTPNASASFPPLLPSTLAATPSAPTPVPTRENSVLGPTHPWRMASLDYATAPTALTETQSEPLSPTVMNAALSSIPDAQEVEPRPNKRARVESLPRLPTFLHPSRMRLYSLRCRRCPPCASRACCPPLPYTPDAYPADCTALHATLMSGDAILSVPKPILISYSAVLVSCTHIQLPI